MKEDLFSVENLASELADMKEEDLFLVEDFVPELADIDQRVSKGAIVKCTPALVFVFKEESNDIKPHQPDGLVTYFPKFPEMPSLGFFDLARKKGERAPAFPAYVIWKDVVVRHFRTIFDKGQGIGHADLKRIWLALSITCVRYRVLSHPILFPQARLRTLKTLLHHRLLFDKSGNDFSGIQAARATYAKKLPVINYSDPYHIDAFVTTMLFEEAMDQGVPRDLALEYLFG